MRKGFTLIELMIVVVVVVVILKNLFFLGATWLFWLSTGLVVGFAAGLASADIVKKFVL